MPYPMYDPDRTRIPFPLLALMEVARRSSTDISFLCLLHLLREQLLTPEAWVSAWISRATREPQSSLAVTARTLRKALNALNQIEWVIVDRRAGRGGNRIRLELSDVLRHDEDQAFLQVWLEAVLECPVQPENRGAALKLLVVLAALVSGHPSSAITINRQHLRALTGLTSAQLDAALANLSTPPDPPVMGNQVLSYKRDLYGFMHISFLSKVPKYH